MSLATGRSRPQTDTSHAGFRDQGTGVQRTDDSATQVSAIRQSRVQHTNDGAQPAWEARSARQPRDRTSAFPNL